MRDPQTLAQSFDGIIQAAFPQLKALEQDFVANPIAPGKWSRLELLGHLIDSAANNHQRFIRAQFQDNLCFNGYQQDKWVKVQAYQTADWQALCDLWYQYNQHLVRVVAHLSKDLFLQANQDHNFNQIAFKIVPEGEVSSLAYFIHDYIGHLEHHLRQIIPVYTSHFEAYENTFHL